CQVLHSRAPHDNGPVRDDGPPYDIGPVRDDGPPYDIGPVRDDGRARDSRLARDNGPVSTLGFALLSLLTRGPATGYDLAQRMKAPIGHFWTAKHSQIYPELARLAEAGHVRVRSGAGPG